MTRKLPITILAIILSVCASWGQRQQGLVPVGVKVGGPDANPYFSRNMLLIANSAYGGQWDRIGSLEPYAREVRQAFGRLGFAVETRRNLRKSEFRSAISDFFSRHGSVDNNCLIIYFVGHSYSLTSGGQMEEYLAPIDASPILAASEGISLNEIQGALFGVESRHVLVIVDGDVSGQGLFDVGNTQFDFDVETMGKAHLLLSAGESAVNHKDTTSFRSHLLQSLKSKEADRNRDDYILTDELYSIMQERRPQTGYASFEDEALGQLVLPLDDAPAANSISVKESAAALEYGLLRIENENEADLYIDGIFRKRVSADRHVVVGPLLATTHEITLMSREDTVSRIVEVRPDRTVATFGADGDYQVDTDFTVDLDGSKLNMRGVSGNTFMMGSDDPVAGADEKPHTVTVGDFAIAKTEVTNAQFCHFLNSMSDLGYRNDGWIGLNVAVGNSPVRIDFNGTRYVVESGYEEYPVTHVSWTGALAYCRWLSGKTGQEWRLPTEAEWEYAAKGGEATQYPGSYDLDQVGWYYSTGSSLDDGVRQVGRKRANGYGLFDMAGNVSEWCSDWFGDYQTGFQVNPVGPKNGTLKVARGGSWFSTPQFCRVSSRGRMDPRDFNFLVGFRPCFSL